MKGHISKRLERVLADPVAREELSRAMQNRGKGLIHLGDETYRVAPYRLVPKPPGFWARLRDYIASKRRKNAPGR